MFVVSATAHGIRQPLSAYNQVAGAIAHAMITATTATDRSRIYRVANADDPHAAVAAVGVGDGTFLAGVTPVNAASFSDTAKVQVVITAITNEILGTEAVFGESAIQSAS